MKPSLLLTIPLVVCAACNASKPMQPNVIIIMSDDQGYQDVGCYGSPDIKTPSIDRMASQGLRLTDFYQASSVSSPSRAAVLTGRLTTRNGVAGVYFPNENGLPAEQVTIAEALKEQGYATACFGKWHLGDAPECMPLSSGFDSYFGIPFSNDMYASPLIDLAEDVVLREGYTVEMYRGDQQKAKQSRGAALGSGIGNLVPLVEGGEVVEFPCDQTTITRRYFDRAIDFIMQSRAKRQPFFIYLTPAMPHTPLYASEQFLGSSDRGLYGDCVEEIDWNVGRLLDMLDSEGLSENTMVIYTSDNGPWLQRGEDGGCAAPLRDGKFNYYEGGVRVPFIVRWSGVVPQGESSDAVIASIDLFPTIMHYAGVEAGLYDVDGDNISAFLENPAECGAEHDEYTYVRNGAVHGVRKGDWVYLPYSGLTKGDAELFNLKDDISERSNVIEEYPEVLAQMKALFESKCNE